MELKKIAQIVYEALTTKTTYYGIKVDASGWAKTKQLIERINFMLGNDILDNDVIFQIVYKNPQYSTNLFRTKIRANITENKNVFKSVIPPDKLYYKTNRRYNIDENFIITPAENSKYIELTSDEESSQANFVLIISAGKMFTAGYKFYTKNNKYYTEKLPSSFIIKIRRL